MKNHRSILIVLAVEAVLCIIAAILQTGAHSLFTAAVTFPFEQLGNALRTLSLTGSAGNVGAWIIYCLISLLPASFFLWRTIRKKYRPEDLLLPALSLLLFISLYLFINPAYFGSLLPMAGLDDGGKLMFGACIYSLLLGYIILRALRSFTTMETAGRIVHLTRLINAIAAVFVSMICFINLSENLNIIGEINASNTGAPSGLLQWTTFFRWLSYAADSLPYALDIFILFMVRSLLHALKEDRYGDNAVVVAGRLCKVCKNVVIINVFTCIALNIAQLIMSKKLLNANYSIQIPLLSIALVLVILLISEYFAGDNKLKKENDLFI